LAQDILHDGEATAQRRYDYADGLTIGTRFFLFFFLSLPLFRWLGRRNRFFFSTPLESPFQFFKKIYENVTNFKK
jgi:hypothetical protein